MSEQLPNPGQRYFSSPGVFVGETSASSGKHELFRCSLVWEGMKVHAGVVKYMKESADSRGAA